MKVLGILGSPLRGGNAELLLDRALAGAESNQAESEKLILNELQFVGCQNCGGCDQTGICVIADEMQSVYEKMEQAQVVIIASPIFFGSLSAQTKAMIDRFQCCWIAKEVLGKSAGFAKKGGLILVEGTKRESFFKNAESVVKNLFAVLNIEFSKQVYCPNTDKKAEVLKHEDCLAQAFELGKKITDNN
ncbi:MAG: flavodoxin family protein [Candidatus Omnitrophica bacterium]|nr:flavodoxin family protein [Candidatus Omnitrophota bacterium]